MYVQLQHFRLNDAKIDIFYLCHMKDHEASITFHQKTWHHDFLAFMLLALKNATEKSYFLHYDI